MFFRRPKPVEPTFEDRLNALRKAGFTVNSRPDGWVMAGRAGCGALIRDVPGSEPAVLHAGWLIGDEIALLVDGGYQKFWAVDGKRRAPALAAELKALHAFDEDLREALGLESLYNMSLGTTNDLHMYDRVLGRDQGGRQRPWQK